jgi:S1-C subfamily serine protease
MLHSDANKNNNDATIPNRSSIIQDDPCQGWTDPDQYNRGSMGSQPTENYGPVAFPIADSERLHSSPTLQAGLSVQPDAGDSLDCRVNRQKEREPLRSSPVWGPPSVPNHLAFTSQPMYVPSPSHPKNRSAISTLMLSLVLLVVFGVGLFAGWVFARNGAGASAYPNLSNTLQSNSNSKATIPAVNSNGSNLDAVREAVISSVKPAVVQINVVTNNGGDLGSGVIIDKRGYIVTNNHVIVGGRSIQVVLADNSKYVARIVGTDPTDDLAVVKIDAPANLVTAKLGNSSQLQVGQEVLAIGNPLGITQTVTRGIVSALDRNVSEQNGGAMTIPGAIQTDAPINPGNSGGALVDLRGEVIGIPTLAAVDPQYSRPANGVGFAIPSNRVAFIAQQLIQNGKVTHSGRAAMGIKAQTVDKNMANMAQLSVDHGVFIASVSDGGPAQRASLQVGDVIVQINNTQIDTLSALQDALFSKNPGDQISVKVYRGSQQLTVSVTLVELQL